MRLEPKNPKDAPLLENLNERQGEEYRKSLPRSGSSGAKSSISEQLTIADGRYTLQELTKAELQNALKSLASVSIKPSGVVLNAYDASRSRYGRYGSKYGAHYGAYSYKYDSK